MSWVIERPRPVPSPAGLVVKNGFEHLFLRNGRDAIAVVANANFHCASQVLRGDGEVRLEVGLRALRFALGRCIEAVRD